ncbi:MAG: prepilin-type N-terminal cleavage/methylation domain-containing protein [Rhizobiaceae bacterium]
MATTKQGNQGFLLLEMLVALAVVAVMGALMSSFLGQLGSVNRLENEIAAQTELDAAAAYLQRTLSGARPVKLLDAEPDTDPFIDGEETSVRFATVTRRGLYSLALRDVHIFSAGAGNQRSLEHTMGPRRLLNGNPVPHGRSIPILDSIESISFEYSDGSEWSGDWGRNGELPKAIRIRISKRMGNKQLSTESIAEIY